MEPYIVSEETEEMIGMKIVDDGDCVILVDIDTLDDMGNSYTINKNEIPRLIEGLKKFVEG